MIERALVLIVEDDLDLATALDQILRRSGYETMLAANGVEALAVVDQRMPSVILLDMRMPVMDGWEFARELFARHGRTIPIIVMTAAENARQRAAEIGAAEVVSKPFDVKRLIALIQRLASRAQPAYAER